MRIFFILSALLLFACNNPSGSGNKQAGKVYSIAGNQDGGEEITCWGIGEIDLDDDMASLEEKVGRKGLSQDSLMKEGAFEGFVTKLWKGTAKEIVVHWKEKKAPYAVIDYLEVVQPASPYHFANGIKIGTSLNDIIKLNGGTAVNLYGFGWDYGGTFIDFGKGKLAGDIPCFGGVFALPDNIKTDDSREITGDIKITSSHPALKNYEVKLVAIRVVNK